MESKFEEIARYLKDINEKTNKTTDFKNIQLFIKWKSQYENGINTALHTDHYSPAIDLDSTDYEIALLDIEAYFTFPNITNKMTHFRYYSGKDSAWKTFEVLEGTYNIQDLQKYMNNKLDENGETKVSGKYAIEFEANGAALRCEMTIATGYRVDFSIPGTFNVLLGFNPIIYTAGFYLSENDLDIIDIASIYVNCDLIKNSYLNGSSYPAIYSFFPNVPPGFKIVEKTNHPVFLPINRRNISSIAFWLTDQENRLINFRNQYVTIRLMIRKIPFK